MADRIADIMWIAFENNFETRLIELAIQYMTEGNLARLEAYEKALSELLIKQE